MKIKTTCLPFFDGIEAKEATFQQKNFPAHYHDTYSIGIITQGYEKIHLVGKDIVAHANSVIVINPYELHANTYFNADAWDYKCLYVSADVMCAVGKVSFLPYFPTELIDDAQLAQSLRLFFAGRQDVDSLACLLRYLIQNYAEQKPTQELNTSALTPILEAQQYLTTHCQDKIDLATVATKYHLSKCQFIRNFKKQTGLTPISYLLMHRINQAQKLIREGFSLTEAGLAVGFYDQAHFIKYFQKYIGISPMQYKKGVC